MITENDIKLTEDRIRIPNVSVHRALLILGSERAVSLIDQRAGFDSNEAAKEELRKEITHYIYGDLLLEIRDLHSETMRVLYSRHLPSEIKPVRNRFEKIFKMLEKV